MKWATRGFKPPGGDHPINRVAYSSLVGAPIKASCEPESDLECDHLASVEHVGRIIAPRLRPIET